jgi:hypothetical protein
MARQAGDYRFIGSLDDFCFYKMCGAYYVRRKSSLTGKRFWKDKSFEGSRRSSNRFAEGNRLASKVYHLVTKEKRVYPLFCFLKRRAILLLKEEKSLQEVEALLSDYMVAFGFISKVKNEAGDTACTETVRYTMLPNVPDTKRGRVLQACVSSCTTKTIVYTTAMSGSKEQGYSHYG